MKKIFLIITILIFSQFVIKPVGSDDEPSGYIIDGNSVIWENQYGKLEIFPHTSTNIVTQTQYANVTWYYPDNYIDIAFRFENPLSNAGIWLWRNISHNVSVPIQEWIEGYYDENNTWIEGYWWISGYEIQEQFWFDWKDMKHHFQHQEYNGKHYYYVSNVPVVQDKSYLLKWQYDITLNTDGKWELMGKLHSDTIQEALDSGRYIMIDPWWDSDWLHYRSITVNCTSYVDTTLTNFPILVVFDNSSYHIDSSKSVRFLSTDNSTEFAYEIEDWDDTGNCSIWVNISDALTSATNYTFLMYYNNSAATDNQNPSGVWHSSYTAVYHMNVTVAPLQDSTSNDDDSTATSGTPVYNKTGKMYNSVFYATSGEDHTIPQVLTNAEWNVGMTVSLWMYLYSDSDSEYIGVSMYDDVEQYAYIKNSGGLKACFFNQYDPTGNDFLYGTTAITKNNWWHITISYDGANKHIYTNGADEQTSAEGGINQRANSNTIGNSYGHGASGADSDIDEVRISKVCRNDSWVATTYHNQNRSGHLGDFLTFGAEHSAPVNNPPTIDGENPVNQTTDLGLNPKLNVTVDDLDDDTLNATWFSNSSGSWIAFDTNDSIDTSGGAVNISQEPANFSDFNTTYYWSVNVTDDTDWTNETYWFETTQTDPPEITLNSPLNGSGLNLSSSVTLSVTVEDDYGHNMTVKFYGDQNLVNTHVTDGNETVTYVWNVSGLHNWSVVVNESYNTNNTNDSGWWFANGYYNDTFYDDFYIEEYYGATVDKNFSYVYNAQAAIETHYGTITLGTDDCVENPAAGGTPYFSSEIQWSYLGYFSATYKKMSHAVRYQNIPISNSWTVIDATLAIYPYLMDASTVDVNITGILEANTPTYSTGNRPWSRKSTDANVDYPMPTPANKWKTTNITTVVQEIINQKGWDSGNALGILCRGNDTAHDCRPRTYEYNSAQYATTLNITYWEHANHSDITTFTITKPTGTDWDNFTAYVNNPDFVNFTIHDGETGYIRLENLNASYTHDISMLYDDTIYVYGYFNSTTDRNMTGLNVTWSAAAPISIGGGGGRDRFALGLCIGVMFMLPILYVYSENHKEKNKKNK